METLKLEQPAESHASVRTFSKSSEKKDRRPEQSLTYDIVTEEGAFLGLRSEWNTLADRSPVTVYQTFDWQWFWWKYYGAGNTLHIITFRSSGRLVGILPAFIQPHVIFGKVVYRRLRLMGCGVDTRQHVGIPSEYGPSDYLDAIVEPAAAEQTAQLFAGMMTSQFPEFDELHWSQLPDSGTIRQYFLPALARKGLHMSLKDTEICPFLSLPSTTEEVLSQLRTGMRFRLRHAKREFTAHPPYSLDTISHRSMLDHAFTEMIYLHQIRWNRLGYAGLFADQRFIDFQRDVIRTFFEQGKVWFKTVTMGGIQTAARLGFMYKGRMYDYLSGFDDTLPGSKKRPSLALLYDMIGDAIDHGLEILDFLRGDEAYKFDLTREHTRNAEISMPVPGKRMVRKSAYKLSRFFGAAVRRFANEWALWGIQRSIHGTVRSIPLTMAFVFRRMKHKMHRQNSKDRNDVSSKE